jgi:hypothetical protein
MMRLCGKRSQTDLCRFRQYTSTVNKYRRNGAAQSLMATDAELKHWAMMSQSKMVNPIFAANRVR